MGSFSFKQASFWLLIICIGFNASLTTADTPAPAPAPDCLSALLPLLPCLDFVQGNASTPPKNCCVGLSDVAQTSPSCLCSLFNSSSLGISVNTTLALELPALCNVSTPASTQCAALGVPVSGVPPSSPPTTSPTSSAPSTPPATPPTVPPTAGTPAPTSAPPSVAPASTTTPSLAPSSPPSVPSTSPSPTPVSSVPSPTPTASSPTPTPSSSSAPSPSSPSSSSPSSSPPTPPAPAPSNSKNDAARFTTSALSSITFFTIAFLQRNIF